MVFFEVSVVKSAQITPVAPCLKTYLLNKIVGQCAMVPTPSSLMLSLSDFTNLTPS